MLLVTELALVLVLVPLVVTVLVSATVLELPAFTRHSGN